MGTVNKVIWRRTQKNKRHRVTPIEVTVLQWSPNKEHAVVSWLRGKRICGAIVQTKNLEGLE